MLHALLFALCSKKELVAQHMGFGGDFGGFNVKNAINGLKSLPVMTQKTKEIGKIYFGETFREPNRYDR